MQIVDSAQLNTLYLLFLLGCCVYFLTSASLVRIKLQHALKNGKDVVRRAIEYDFYRFRIAWLEFNVVGQSLHILFRACVYSILIAKNTSSEEKHMPYCPVVLVRRAEQIEYADQLVEICLSLQQGLL